MLTIAKKEEEEKINQVTNAKCEMGAELGKELWEMERCFILKYLCIYLCDQALKPDHLDKGACL